MFCTFQENLEKEKEEKIEAFYNLFTNIIRRSFNAYSVTKLYCTYI